MMRIHGSGIIEGLAVGGLPAETVTPDQLTQKMMLMGPVAAAGSAVDFNGIPAWAKRLTAMASTVTANTTTTLQVLLGTAAGLEAAGYSNTFASITTGFNAASVYAGGIVINSTGAAGGGVVSGKVTLNLADAAANVWLGESMSTIVTVPNILWGFSRKALPGKLDRVRVNLLAGAFNAGSLSLLVEG